MHSKKSELNNCTTDERAFVCPTLDDLLGDLVLALSSPSSFFFACLGRPVPPAAAGAAQSRTKWREAADAIEEMQVLEAKVFFVLFLLLLSFAFLSFAFFKIILLLRNLPLVFIFRESVRRISRWGHLENCGKQRSGMRCKSTREQRSSTTKTRQAPLTIVRGHRDRSWAARRVW